MAHEVGVIGGDGIGPEVVAEALKVVAADHPDLVCHRSSFRRLRRKLNDRPQSGRPGRARGTRVRYGMPTSTRETWTGRISGTVA